MKKQLMVFAGLALASGMATAQPQLPDPAAALGDLTALLDFIVGEAGGGLIGEHAENGTDPYSEGAGSGLLGGADLLGDVLNGAGIELSNGSEEGGAFLGNSLLNAVNALVDGIEAGNQGLIDALLLIPSLTDLTGGLPGLPGGGGGGGGPLGPLQGLIDTLLGLLDPGNLPLPI